MRIASGVTDQYIYFVAVDATDYVSFETGLSSFTVRRSRNGGASAAFTTPTINETDSSNMPGVYELLLDEDMTIDSGDAEQEVCLRITHAGMAPVTRVYTLFRPDVTAGETLTVSSGSGNAAVQSIANNAITAASIATGAIDADAIADNAIDAGAFAADAITAAKVASDVGTEIGTAVWATGTRTLTALDEDSTTIDIDNSVWGGGTRTLTVLDEDNTTLDLDATIRAAVGLASANLDTQLDALPTAAENTTAVWAAGARTLTAIDEDSTTLDLDATIRGAVGIASANLDTQLTGINTNIDANEIKIDVIDGIVDAILVDTGTDIPASIANVDSDLAALVADIGADGSGLTAIPWNATWDAEVQSEVNDGLIAYDAATGSDVSGVTSPTAEAIADEVQTRTLDANIVSVLNEPIIGTGTEDNPWNPESP